MAAPFDLERLYDDHAQALFASCWFYRNEATLGICCRNYLLSWFSGLAWLGHSGGAGIPAAAKP